MQCNLWFAILLLAGFPFDVAEAQEHCAGPVAITADSGTITDHTGPGHYLTQQNCVWTFNDYDGLRSGNEQLVFTVTKLDLEFFYDHLHIVGNSVVYAGLTGTVSDPATLDSIIVPLVPNLPIIVIFTSDYIFTRSGFALDYYIASCPSACSSNGVCLPNNTCQCFAGFTGDACSERVCGDSGDCNGAGTCIQPENVCNCDLGSYGADCSSDYCYGLQVIRELSGSFSDHIAPGNYRSNTYCEWLIEPPYNTSLHSAPPLITLTFTSFDLATLNKANFNFSIYDYDYVRVYDGRNASSPLLQELKGSDIPRPIVAASGAMFILFSTTPLMEKSGFDAYFEVDTCSSDCGRAEERGICYQGVCHCHVGFQGPECETAVCENDCGGSEAGSCNETTGICDCVEPFIGRDCSQCEPSNVTACSEDHCPFLSVQTFTEDSGTLVDSRGASEYLLYNYCTFVISPNVSLYSFDSIVLTFSYFDVFPDGAYVLLNDGDLREVARYSGFTLPSPVVVGTDSLHLIFSTLHGQSPGGGFVANYRTISCGTEGCNNGGLCVGDGGSNNTVCRCAPGFTGPSCSQYACLPVDAVGDQLCGEAQSRGVCQPLDPPLEGSRCHCAPGYYGPDCSQHFCSGTTVLQDMLGRISDHDKDQASFYRANSDCSWLILASEDDATVALTFVEFALDFYHDYVSVYDGPNTSSALLSFKQGLDIPDPVTSSGPAMLVTFYSNEDAEFSGFTAYYSIGEGCPNSCSGRGICINGTCSCQAQYGLGPEGDCSAEAPDINVLVPGDPNHSSSTGPDSAVANFTLRPLSWKFFRFRIPETPAVSELKVTATVAPELGDNFRMYLRSSTLLPRPGRSQHDFADNSVNDEKQILIRASPFESSRLFPTAEYTIGIQNVADPLAYAQQQLRSASVQDLFVSLQLSFVLFCLPDCENGGTCIDGVCRCSSCWDGPTCIDTNTDICGPAAKCHPGGICLCPGCYSGPHCNLTNTNVCELYEECTGPEGGSCACIGCLAGPTCSNTNTSVCGNHAVCSRQSVSCECLPNATGVPPNCAISTTGDGAESNTGDETESNTDGGNGRGGRTSERRPLIIAGSVAVILAFLCILFAICLILCTAFVCVPAAKLWIIPTAHLALTKKVVDASPNSQAADVLGSETEGNMHEL